MPTSWWCSVLLHERADAGSASRQKTTLGQPHGLEAAWIGAYRGMPCHERHCIQLSSVACRRTPNHKASAAYTGHRRAACIDDANAVARIPVEDEGFKSQGPNG